VSLIVGGFCRQVFKELPMEFAVEAQKLLSVSLEGSVGRADFYNRRGVKTAKAWHGKRPSIRQGHGKFPTQRTTMLEIKNLHAKINGREILKGVNLTVRAGEVHSIMGPNGSGKSTLAQVLAGRESYEVTEGEVLYRGKNLLEMSPEERACEGVFLAFQYPVEIPGVNNTYFLKAAVNAIRKYHGQEELDAMDFLALMKNQMKLLDMDEGLLSRSVNEGFSGGRRSGTRSSTWRCCSPHWLSWTRRTPGWTSMQ